MSPRAWGAGVCLETPPRSSFSPAGESEPVGSNHEAIFSPNSPHVILWRFCVPRAMREPTWAGCVLQSHLIFSPEKERGAASFTGREVGLMSSARCGWEHKASLVKSE